MEERRERAVEAAVAVARRLGLDSARPAILADANNTLVHFVDARVVAKVGTSHFRDAELESLERELLVAAYLAERGAPVVAPVGGVAPGPHRRGSLTVTLWQYEQPAGATVLDPVEVAAALKSIHRALTDFPSPLPLFTLELVDARRLLKPERSPALTPNDRQFLLDVVDELGSALAALVGDTRSLHGSPHGGNWLPTARGLLLLDFETACRGPAEWDIAALDDRAAAFFPEADLELIALLRRMRSACVAAKCWVEPNRAPELFEAAHVHLKLLRGQPLD